MWCFVVIHISANGYYGNQAVHGLLDMVVGVFLIQYSPQAS